jgi:hypothetical protein
MIARQIMFSASHCCSFPFFAGDIRYHPWFRNGRHRLRKDPGDGSDRRAAGTYESRWFGINASVPALTLHHDYRTAKEHFSNSHSTVLCGRIQRNSRFFPGRV